MKYISDEELTRAAKKVGEAIRKSLPDPETCRHEFSPEFQKKIEVLKEQGRRKEQKIKYLKRACIAATIPFVAPELCSLLIRMLEPRYLPGFGAYMKTRLFIDLPLILKRLFFQSMKLAISQMDMRKTRFWKPILERQ